jgi:antitoxin component of RelBE/YafQ-DinJ toxin-antitoxin module
MTEMRWFKFRAPDSLRTEIRQTAEDLGVPASQWVRQLVRHAIRHQASPAEMRRELAGLRREINAIGNNLNQLAARANADSPVAEDELRRELNQLQGVRRQITEALHRR